MVLLLNKATRLFDEFLGLSKGYTAEIIFGMKTDTLDIGGNIIHKEKVQALDREKLVRVIRRFKGNIEQIVPMYSAIKHRGKPLYKFAREGINIERLPREVEISEIKIIKIKGDRLTIEVSCSSGTYIRTLAHDIGKEYGTGAILAGLRRNRIGELYIGDSASLDMIKGLSRKEKVPETSSWIISLQDLVRDIPSIYIKEDYIEIIKNGTRIREEMLHKKSFPLEKTGNPAKYLKSIISVRSADGKIIAIQRIIKGVLAYNKGILDKVSTKNVVIF